MYKDRHLRQVTAHRVDGDHNSGQPEHLRGRGLAQDRPEGDHGATGRKGRVYQQRNVDQDPAAAAPPDLPVAEGVCASDTFCSIATVAVTQ